MAKGAGARSELRTGVASFMPAADLPPPIVPSVENTGECVVA